MTVKVKKHPKNIDSATQTRFLMIAVRLAPACALLGGRLAACKECYTA